MIAVIEKAEFKEIDVNQYGTFYLHNIHYINTDGGKVCGVYRSKSKDQTKFVAGVEAEFVQTTHLDEFQESYFIIQPISNQNRSNFNKQLSREQSKYSGFAMAYAKDLVVAGKIPLEAMYYEAKEMIDWMVKQDKDISNG